MKNKKIVKAGISLLLVGVVGVGATLAYLTDKTDPVKNTFTIGEGYVDDDMSQALVLDEKNTSTEEDEKWSNFEGRTISGNAYEFIPGGTYEKDPTVHLRADSVDSYLFVKITGLDDLLGTGYYLDKEEGYINEHWKKINNTGKYDGIYTYVASQSDEEGLVINKTNVSLTNKDKHQVEYYNLEAIFEKLLPNNNITKMPAKGTPIGEIKVEACAVQAKNNSYTNAVTQAEGMFTI